jgi:hypothetical protein
MATADLLTLLMFPVLVFFFYFLRTSLKSLSAPEIYGNPYASSRLFRASVHIMAVIGPILIMAGGYALIHVGDQWEGIGLIVLGIVCFPLFRKSLRILEKKYGPESAKR